MPAIDIKFNNFDLQDTNFKTRMIRHKNLPEKNIDLEPIARGDSFHIVNVYYPRKEIRIEGMLVCSSVADLRTKVDDLKKFLRPKEQNLDIDYGGSTLRYTATVSSLDIPDDFYHISACPYRITFLCKPFGKEITTNSRNFDNITNSTYTNSISITSSVDPSPLIRITVDAATALNKIKFVNQLLDGITNSITVSQSFVTNSILTIDCDEKTVKIGNTNSDFLGVFPEFNPSTNSFTLIVTSSAHSVDLHVEYYPTYL